MSRGAWPKAIPRPGRAGVQPGAPLALPSRSTDRSRALPVARRDGGTVAGRGIAPLPPPGRYSTPRTAIRNASLGAQAKDLRALSRLDGLVLCHQRLKVFPLPQWIEDGLVFDHDAPGGTQKTELRLTLQHLDRIVGPVEKGVRECPTAVEPPLPTVKAVDLKVGIRQQLIEQDSCTLLLARRRPKRRPPSFRGS